MDAGVARGGRKCVSFERKVKKRGRKNERLSSHGRRFKTKKNKKSIEWFLAPPAPLLVGLKDTDEADETKRGRSSKSI